ncbi:CPXV062 protein [Cowpox virus]|uniref:Protein OPG058 n=1 Tax=Cowpox virus TaxID=10243 RepID=A0A212PWP1_COWPX|nr:CPXV062 protein [Cowpox virus]SNB51369.1 CPXV062 protein [Cowpox virus]SNB53278.1 CPXV062 protein [Cowpox virus]SPN68707.1 CPXV062 protein [Cowpox virus]SPQ84239.1 CPXV062 protein [Cowpox virus]
MKHRVYSEGLGISTDFNSIISQLSTSTSTSTSDMDIEIDEDDITELLNILTELGCDVDFDEDFSDIADDILESLIEQDV